MDDISEKYFAIKNTVFANYLFTFPVVILQSISGGWLVWYVGYGWFYFWLIVSYDLYLIAGLCWIPVVWLQIQLKTILREAYENKAELPLLYFKYFKIWFWFGWPAFLSFKTRV